MTCPAKWKLECKNCPYSKEGLCDYPYIENIIVGEVQEDDTNKEFNLSG